MVTSLWNWVFLVIIKKQRIREQYHYSLLFSHTFNEAFYNLPEYYFYFFNFIATPMTYESAWTRDESAWTRDGNTKNSCDLHHSRSKPGSFSPLHQAGDRTHTSAAAQATAVRFLSHCTAVGTPLRIFFKNYLFVWLFSWSHGKSHLQTSGLTLTSGLKDAKKGNTRKCSLNPERKCSARTLRSLVTLDMVQYFIHVSRISTELPHLYISHWSLILNWLQLDPPIRTSTQFLYRY